MWPEWLCDLLGEEVFLSFELGESHTTMQFSYFTIAEKLRADVELSLQLQSIPQWPLALSPFLLLIWGCYGRISSSGFWERAQSSCFRVQCHSWQQKVTFPSFYMIRKSESEEAGRCPAHPGEFGKTIRAFNFHGNLSHIKNRDCHGNMQYDKAKVHFYYFTKYTRRHFRMKWAV